MKKRLKGFTLVELVIVIAIIGILASVGLPNLFSRLQKSKHDSAQSMARSIFNSAQTVAQKYEVIDRAITDDDKKFLHSNVHGDGKNTHYFGNITSVGMASTDKINEEKTAADNKVGTEFYEKLSAMNTHLNNCKWIVIVKDYKVTHVLWAEDDNDKYVGVYCGCGDSHKDYEWYKDSKNINTVFNEVDK